MKTYFAAVALAATLAQPASAMTFPTLTTIYVGSGVRDEGGAVNAGIATGFNCSNVSGVAAQVRFLVLGLNGFIAADVTATIPHGATRFASTHLEATFSRDFDLATGAIQGAVNIESTQSGVFCNAMITDADAGERVDLASRPREPASRHGGVASHRPVATAAGLSIYAASTPIDTWLTRTPTFALAVT